jgi:hypothetical protein
LEGLNGEQVEDEAYRTIMGLFFHAIKHNCFEEEDLKNLKKAFPWIGEGDRTIM